MDITITNPLMVRVIANSPDFKTTQFKAISEPQAHKFKAGDEVTLHGLESYPEYNGDTVKIASLRNSEGDEWGPSYYISGRIVDDGLINWTYEYRLK